MQNLWQMLYAGGSSEVFEGFQPCYERTVVYPSGSQTFSVHGALSDTIFFFSQTPKAKRNTKHFRLLSS
jgi:hypothetical protein